MELEQAIETAEHVWDKLIAFSSYGFNKSHAFAYSVMTYQSQWMKVNYPLEFWTTSLHFSKDVDVPKRISEMRRLKQGIDIKPPSINNSNVDFDCNIETMNIYWSLTKIKNVGQVATNIIINERDKNGYYGSFDDFIARVPKNKVNKKTVTNLILAGAFDELENLYKNTDRLALLQYHYTNLGDVLPDEYDTSEVYKTIFWTMKQRDLTGFGTVDYKYLLRNHKDKQIKNIAGDYLDGEKFFASKDYSKAVICGKVTQVVERKSKYGKFLVVGMICNDDFISTNIWNDTLMKYEDLLMDCQGKIIAISGKVKFDTWKNQNCLNTNDETVVTLL